jgi:signal transduction histidine kinase
MECISPYAFYHCQIGCIRFPKHIRDFHDYAFEDSYIRALDFRETQYSKFDITDDVKEKDRVEDVVLDENKEYNFEPLFIRILDKKSHQKIIETQYFPQDIELNNKYLDSLKENIVIFKEQNNYLISRIKIDFNDSLKIIIEVATTKDIIWETLKELIYILAFIIPIILIFSIIGGNFLIYKSFAPIEKVLEELKNINASDLSARLKNPNNQDEINQLVIEINSLLTRLESSFERISQFSSDASHELKTPLTVIKGELEVALRKDRQQRGSRSAEV